MKNLSIFIILVILVSISNQLFGQLGTPTDDVCPGDTVDYTIDPDYYGEQEFLVIKVFS